MSVATSTAIIVASSVAAGATVYGAHKAGSAAEHAADTQASSADKALGVQKEMYEQQRSDLSPYRAAGQGSVGQLSYLLGVPGFEKGPMSQMAKPAATTGTAPAPPPYGGLTSNDFLGSIIGGKLPPGAQQLQTTAPGAGSDPLASFKAGQAAAGGGPMVTVRAPTGETRAIPQSQLQKALTLGGQIVYGGQ